MNVLLFGATGMVGRGVLLECLDAAPIKSVLVVGRNPCGVVHQKLDEVILDDLFNVESLGPALADRDACFFCLGISSVGLPEDAYYRVTHDLTLAVARALLAAAPHSVFLYVSGAGTDSTERGRVRWARVKGKTENELLGLGFRAAYMFRPGLIQPLRGVRSRTGWYQALYTVMSPVVPLMRRLAPQLVTTTVAVGRGMIRVAAEGYSKPILDTRDINRLAAPSR